MCQINTDPMKSQVGISGFRVRVCGSDGDVIGEILFGFYSSGVAHLQPARFLRRVYINVTGCPKN